MVLNKKRLESKFSPRRTMSKRSHQHHLPHGGGEGTSGGGQPRGTGNNGSPPMANIKVFVRVRPFNHRESGARSVVNLYDDNALVFDPQEVEDEFFFHGLQQKCHIPSKKPKNMMFDYNRVFKPEETNEEVYVAATKNIVSSVFEGYNCSVFAYGATGAGKTYTMLGNEDQPGITYLTMVELLNFIDDNQENMDVTLGASYIEVYNENVRDLLSPTAPPLHVRDNAGQVAIAGLRIEKITEKNRLFSLLEFGNTNRSQHPTDSNAESSRSHAIFQVHVKIVLKGSGEVKLSKLSMIDLAGSERGAATGCAGLRFKEGSNINKSLLALGNCINALADGLRHVPYRDSKLTRILKDSLGGNCRTVMVANIAPSSMSYEDTYNTLKYAMRAKTIKTRLSKNVHESLSIHQLKKRNEELQAKVDKYEKDKCYMPDLKGWSSQIDTVMEEKKDLLEKLLTLQGEYKLLEWRLNNKSFVLSQFDENSDPMSLSRINTSVGQLKARYNGIIGRIKELVPVWKESLAKEEELYSKIQASPPVVAEFLQYIVQTWRHRIEQMESQMDAQHKEKLLRIVLKQRESDKGTFSSMLPVVKQLYTLADAYCYLTQPLKDKYEVAMRSLEGVKTVTWDDADDEDGGASCGTLAAGIGSGLHAGSLNKLSLDDVELMLCEKDGANTCTATSAVVGESAVPFMGGGDSGACQTTTTTLPQLPAPPPSLGLAVQKRTCTSPFRPRNQTPPTIKGNKNFVAGTVNRNFNIYGNGSSVKSLMNKENFGPTPHSKQTKGIAGSSFRSNRIVKRLTPYSAPPALLKPQSNTRKTPHTSSSVKRNLNFVINSINNSRAKNSTNGNNNTISSQRQREVLKMLNNSCNLK